MMELFSPRILLWIAVSVIAIMMLLGSVRRRQTGLTEILKRFVTRSQSRPAPAANPTDDSNASPGQSSSE